MNRIRGIAVVVWLACMAPLVGMGYPCFDFEDHPQLLGWLRAPDPMAAAVDGDIAYFADGDLGLLITDVSDPRSPNVLSTLDGFDLLLDVEMFGHYIVLGDCGGQIIVVDVADPTMPNIIARMDVEFCPGDLEVAGSLVYIAHHHGLDILDLADPAHPEITGTLDFPQDAIRVSVQGGIAYVGVWFDDMCLVDVSDPEHPFVASTFVSPSTAHDAVLDGDYAYVADRGQGLLVLDISDPWNPATIATLANLDVSIRIEYSAGYVYLGDGYAGTQIIDVTDPSHPFLACRLPSALMAQSETEISDGRAYVPVFSRGFQIIDISHPVPQPILGFAETPNGLTEVAARGQYVFATGSPSFQVYDVRRAEAPELVADLSLMDIGQDLALSGHHAFVAAEYTGVHAIDISNPRHPVVVDRYDTSNAAYGIAVQDCYAYVSTFYYTEDLLVLDVSNPADMIQIGRLVLEHEGGSAVEVRGDYAYVASRGVAVIDVSDPTSPYMVGYLPLEAGVWDLALKGHYVLALGQWRGEVAVVNVADPTAPFLAARIYTPMETKGIQVSRNRAYIACQYAGIQVVNLTDPCHPFVEGFVSTDYSPFGVVASCRKHGLLYTALMTSGLQVSPDACTLNAIPGPAGERLPEVTDGRYSLNLQLSGFRDPGDNRGSFTDLDHPMVGDPTRLPFDRPVTGLFPDPAPDDGLTSPICGAKMEAQPQHAEDATTSLMVSPNPANPGTRISFRLTGTQRVRLGIHDLTGRQVVLLVDEELPAGVHTFDWNGADRRGRKVPSGVYLVRMTAGHQAWSRRITIVR